MANLHVETINPRQQVVSNFSTATAYTMCVDAWDAWGYIEDL